MVPPLFLSVCNWPTTFLQRGLICFLVALAVLASQAAYPESKTGAQTINAPFEQVSEDGKRSPSQADDQADKNLYVSRFTKNYVNRYLPWLSGRLDGLEVIDLNFEGALTDGDRSRRRSNFPSDGHGWLLLEIDLNESQDRESSITLVDGCWTFEDWSCRHSSLDELVGSERGLFGGMGLSALKEGEGELPRDAKVLFTFHMRSARPVVPDDREIYCDAYAQLVEVGLNALASGSSARKAVSAVRKEEKAMVGDLLKEMRLSMSGEQDDLRNIIRSLYVQARKNSADFLKILAARGNEKLIQNMISLGNRKLGDLLTSDCLSKLPSS